MKGQQFDDQFTPQSPWLDLVNSQQRDGLGECDDHLYDRKWAKNFLSYWNIRPGSPMVSTADAQCIELREFLTRLVQKIASGKTIGRRDISYLNTTLRVASYSHLVTADDRLTIVLTPERNDWYWIRAQIAASFVQDYLQRPERIKVCGNALCRWAFVDVTKGNIRRWCKDRRCGNRHRVRKFRATRH